MSMTDPIADLLTRIRNAQQARHAAVEIPGSRMKASIVKLLRDEGYIENVVEDTRDQRAILRIHLISQLEVVVVVKDRFLLHGRPWLVWDPPVRRIDDRTWTVRLPRLTDRG